jgi:two-component system, chemotaxis family, protein-glutamate methylesterase/glutaminase
VIGASAGGINVLATIFESIPSDIPAAIVLMLHQRNDSPYQMAGTFRRLTHLPVVTARQGVRLRQGSIYVPSPGKSLSFHGHEVRERGAEKEQHFTSINRTFLSAAEAYGDRVIGVVLTGLLKDGTQGLKAIHDRGGLTIVQDPIGAEYPSMPSSAMKGLPVTFCLDTPDIGVALDLLARRSSHLESGLAISIRMLKKRVELLVRLKEKAGANLGSSDFLGEELVELRRELEAITRLLETMTPSAGR